MREGEEGLRESSSTPAFLGPAMRTRVQKAAYSREVVGYQPEDCRRSSRSLHSRCSLSCTGVLRCRSQVAGNSTRQTTARRTTRSTRAHHHHIRSAVRSCMQTCRPCSHRCNASSRTQNRWPQHTSDRRSRFDHTVRRKGADSRHRRSRTQQC